MVEWEDSEGAEVLPREVMEEAITMTRVLAMVAEEVEWVVVVVVEEQLFA